MTPFAMSLAIPPDKTCIVCGDFNAILTDRTSYMTFLPDFQKFRPRESNKVSQNTDLFNEFLLSRNLPPANI